MTVAQLVLIKLCEAPHLLVCGVKLVDSTLLERPCLELWVSVLTRRIAQYSLCVGINELDSSDQPLDCFFSVCIIDVEIMVYEMQRKLDFITESCRKFESVNVSEIEAIP